MVSSAQSTGAGVRRRTVLSAVLPAALAGALPGGLAAARAAAQAAPVDLSDHPLAGTWLAMANPMLPETPQFPATSLFAADGTVLLVFPLTVRGPDGVVFVSPAVGTWEPDGERRGRFTAVQMLSAADGAFLGTVTIDGHPEVAEDGATFADDGSRVMITIRDPAGAVVQQIMPTGAPVGRPVTAVRMGVGAPGFPETAPAAATPSS